jgi:hypothetical protein
MQLTKHAALTFLTLAALALLIANQTAKAETADGIPLLRTCDVFGNEKQTFVLTENVYVKNGIFFPNQQVNIYVIPKDESITTANAVSGPISATTDSNGHLPITLIWNAPLTVGQYNVWVDANKNGIYDIMIDRPICPIRCWNLFNVVPETWIGTLSPIAAMLTSFALFTLTKHAKRTQTTVRKLQQAVKTSYDNLLKRFLNSC